MKKLILITSALLLGLFISTSFAVEVTVLGPKQYFRTTGKPNLYTDTFPGMAGQGKLLIKNGDTAGKNRLSSALISVNGQQILGPNNFNQQVYNIEVPVNLSENNSVTVQLKSGPASYITIKVIQQLGDEVQVYVKPVDQSKIVFASDTLQLVRDQVLVMFNEDTSNDIINSIISSINGEVVGFIRGLNYYQIEIKGYLSLNELQDIINQLNNNRNIKAASANLINEELKTPYADPGWDPWWGTEPWLESQPDGKNWGLEAIYAPSAWDITTGNPNMKVGIVENGCKVDHQDIQLDSNHVLGSDKNCYAHGTRVAGIIGAKSNNGVGITGIMWEKDLYVYRILTSYYCGLFSATSDVHAGVASLLSQGVKLINVSLGTEYVGNETAKLEEEKKLMTQVMTSWMKPYRYGDSFLIIQAAGNKELESKWGGKFNTIDDPEIRKQIMVVTSINPPTGCPSNCVYTPYTGAEGANFGPLVDIAAPGVNIWTTTAFTIPPSPCNTFCFDSYDYATGTSVAAPHVTGVAGLVWSVNGNLTGPQVKEILVDTSKDRTVNDSEGRLYGRGILNAKAALQPRPFIISSLQILPAEPYGTFVGEFKIENRGPVPITLDVLTIGGRDPEGQVLDFPWKTNVTLEPFSFTQYVNILTLSKVGTYHFFTAYRTLDDQWNTSIPTDDGITNTLDITFGQSPPPPPPPPGGPWPMFGHDPQHTGRSEFTGPQQLNLNWQKQVTAQFSPVSSPIVGPDNTIYIGVNTFDSTSPNNFYGYLKALDPSGSPTKWKELKIGNQIVSTPALAEDGTIYISSINYDNASSTNYFTYLNSIDSYGNLRWRYNLGQSYSGTFKSSPVINYDGKILIASDDGLYAINPDGTFYWKRTLCSNTESSPAIDSSGTIYIVDGCGTGIYAFYSNGTRKFRKSLESFGCSDENSSPSIGPNGEIYFGIHSGCGSNDFNDLVALDAGGNLLWRKKVDGKIYAPPAISNNGTIYVTTLSLSSFKNYLHSFNPDGSLNWSIEIGSYGTLNPPTIDASGTVYVISGGIIQALNQDGTLKWKFNGDIGPDSQPAIDQNGMLYTIGVNMFSAFKP